MPEIPSATSLELDLRDLKEVTNLANVTMGKIFFDMKSHHEIIEILIPYLDSSFQAPL